MYNLTLREPHIFGAFTLAGICLGGIAAYALLRRPSSPDELESKRRDMLVQQGRIIDGTVIDISDLSAEESGRSHGLRLILYQYEIAGVVYECSQDVTLLGHLVDIHDCRPGFPASVRYLPRNPGNSLIVAETWSGLRGTAQSVVFGSPGAGCKVGSGKTASPRAGAAAAQNAGGLENQQAESGPGI